MKTNYYFIIDITGFGTYITDARAFAERNLIAFPFVIRRFASIVLES